MNCTSLTPKGEKTRDRILKAASRLFYAHGYHATGLNSIIQEAGVTKGNFYYYFSSKEELGCSVIDWHKEATIHEIGILDRPADGSSRDHLFFVLNNMATRMSMPTSGGTGFAGCFFGNLALEMSNSSETIRAKIATVFDEMSMALATIIKQARRDGEVADEIDPDRAASLIVTLLEGAAIMGKATHAQTPLTDALTFIRHYLLSRPPISFRAETVP